MRHTLGPVPLMVAMSCVATLCLGCAGETQATSTDTAATGELSRLTFATITGTLYRQTYPAFSDPSHPEQADEFTDRAPLPGTRVALFGISADGARPSLGSSRTDDRGRYGLTVPCVSNMALRVEFDDGTSTPSVTFTGLPLPTISKSINCGIAPAGDVDLFVGPNGDGSETLLPASW